MVGPSAGHPIWPHPTACSTSRLLQNLLAERVADIRTRWWLTTRVQKKLKGTLHAAHRVVYMLASDKTIDTALASRLAVHAKHFDQRLIERVIERLAEIS